MGDTSVDFFLETLKHLITSSKLDSVVSVKPQLQSLEEKIKYLRGFLEVTEKKRNEHSEVMTLVMEIRDVVSKAENIVEWFVIAANKRRFKLRGKAELSLNLKSVKKEIKTLTDEVKQIYYKNIYDINRVAVKKFKLSPARSIGGSDSSGGINTSKVIDAFKADHLSLDPPQGDKVDFPPQGSILGATSTHSNRWKGLWKGLKRLIRSKKVCGGSNKSKVVLSKKNKSKVIKEKVVVGFDDEVKTLLEKLDDGGEGRPLEIITIIGAGGGGKTTLAREVFDHPFTSHAFEICAWVDVSQAYKTTMKRDLLIRVLKSAFPQNQEDYEKISEDMLGEKLLKCLKGRKYLIVMDDIWGIEAWNDIQRSYPNERKGSKVLFTSRQLVQLDSIYFIAHYLDPLPKHRSWELLKKKVFGMNCCPPELVNVGVKIAEKCEGLPLAIVAIAGILATEAKTLKVWEEVAKHLSSIIAMNKEAGCMEILELSYNNLPLHLKACFLYIGAFLEDSEIRVRELLWLWIAEGFIQQSEEGKSLEAIARDHLMDLIDRSLVMVARKSSLGGIKACRIHDLLRVFCLKKAAEENFLVQIRRDYSFSPSLTNEDRRLFISESCLDPDARNLHSLLYLPPSDSHGPYWVSPFGQDISFFANFERLRVLSFITYQWETRLPRRHPVSSYPVHLRYLAIKITFEIEIGIESISNLLNLETLILNFFDYRHGSIQLPRDIFKMVKLRHLYSNYGIFQYHCSSIKAARVGFDHSSKLDSLQTLHQLCACKDCRSFLVRTPNLRKLMLVLVRTLCRYPPCLDLEFLNCLETLSLRKFTFTARLKLPLTIKRLTLDSMHLKWEELSILQNLPSLEVLKFKDIATNGPVWNTSEEGFPQLKYLSFVDVKGFVEEWNASEDQFPRLEVLVLKNCRCLKRIPSDFANLNELREIQVIGCTRSVEESAREIEEEQRNRKGDDDGPNLIVKPYN